MAFSFCGLLLLAYATSFPFLLLAAGLVGFGSAVFHPESSRMARLASGGRHGLAQSLFQVGGNAGTALGPSRPPSSSCRAARRALPGSASWRSREC